MKGYAHYVYINEVVNGKKSGWSFIAKDNILKIDDIEVNDVICGTRDGSKFDSSGEYLAHCDIVTNVSVDKITVVGGNVGDTVEQKDYDIKQVEEGSSKILFFGSDRYKYDIGILRKGGSSSESSSSSSVDDFSVVYDYSDFVAVFSQNNMKINSDNEKYDLNKQSSSFVYNDGTETTFNNLQKIETSTPPLAAMSALEYLNKKAIDQGVDPLLVFLVITQESKGDTFAVSYTGCKGLFQFCKGTALDYKKYFGETGYRNDCKNTYSTSLCSGDPRFDAKDSIDAGVEYIGKLSNAYLGNIPLILSAYNAGAGATSNKCKNLDNEKTLNCLFKSAYTYYSKDGSDVSSGQAKQKEVKNYIENILGNYNKYSN